MDKPGTVVLTPFADFSAGQFLDRVREGGFTPAGAMKLYDEIRKFGHNSVRRVTVDEADMLWDEMRIRHCDRLRQVRTPEDFEDYLRRAPDLFVGQEDASMEIKEELLGRWMTIGNCARIERGEALDRVSGRFTHAQSEQWDAWDEMGMGWDDIEAAIEHDLMVQPAHAGDGQDPIHALVEAVEAAGLVSLEWQAASGAYEFASDLAGNVLAANAELEKRSGWTGGVLGLAGKLSLRMGMENSGVDGRCSAKIGTNQCWIDVGARAGWGVVSHEWMHGLDYAMGFDHESKRTQFASSSQDPANPWHGLISGLRGACVSGVEDLIRADMIDGFKRRWAGGQFPADLPELLDQLRAEQTGLEVTPEAMRASHLQQIKECLVRGGVEVDVATLRAEVAMAELGLVANHEAAIGQGGSIWMQFADRFRDNIIKYHPDMAEDYASYFHSATEQAAHSFEATFGPEGSFITDIVPEAAPMRYPLPAEAMGHKLAWRRLFKVAAPWWEEQANAAARVESQDGHAMVEDTVPVGLAARLSMRSSESSQGPGGRCGAKPVGGPA